jgi:hypothetical protein
MFSSLDRIDIVLKGKDGRREYVQTDHRTAEEIEQEPELSVLFALVRVLNPKRMQEEESPDPKLAPMEPTVIYSTQHQPPDFLWQAIRAAGGQLTVGRDSQPLPVGEPPVLQEVMQSAFAGLARRVADEHHVELTLAGLEAIEPGLAESAGDPEQDEIAYWSAVMKLGSFAGEVIRTSNGGHWEVSSSGSLPFSLSTTFRGSRATVNPLGKAIKRFANGEEDSVAFLVQTVCSRP